MNQPSLSSLPGSSSASTTSSGGKTKASQQAHLLSHATATAIVAAKSILMSGGTEDVALRTAKAAAASVLNPSYSDGDTISRRSLGFFGRRKVRRQAEVVASMALVTATGNIQNGVASDWSASDCTPGSHMNPYAKNITTRPMSTSDEPSVLSGTTRPPRPPLGTSALAQALNNRNVGDIAGSSVRRSSPIINTNSEQVLKEAMRSPRQDSQPVCENVNPIIVPLKSPTKCLFDSPEKTASSTSKNKKVEQENIGALIALGNRSELFDDETTLDPSTVWTHARNNAAWKDLDPLLNTVTNVFSLLTCSPVGGVPHHGARPNGIPRRIAHRHRDFDTVTTGNDDTLDERTDEGTEFRSLDSYDDTQAKDTTVSSSSSGESSIESSYIQDMHSCSAASEGDIKVRNALRNTMEKIVSNSRKEYDDGLDDSKWQTYKLGDRSSRRDGDVGGKRLPAQGRSLKVTRVTPRNRKRGFFAGK